MDDPRPTFVSSIDHTNIRVLDFPGFIFLCGGPNLNVSEDPISARDYILRHLHDKHEDLADRLRQAEDINDWFRDGTYKDLISFELDIGELAALIVIFVESAGSIAELGAFCVLNGLRDKLLIFVQQNKHDDNDSFIRLGLLDHLRGISPESVCVYPWLTTQKETTEVINGISETYFSEVIDESSLKLCTEEIANDIKKRITAPKNPANFEPGNKRHIMLLICDLINQMLALTKKELHDYLHSLNVNMPDDALKRHLFILTKFSFIKHVSRGNHGYFIPTHSFEFVRYEIIGSKVSVDRLRRKNTFREFYEKHDRRRFNAIKSILEGAK